MAKLIMTEEAGAPTTPSSGKWKAYFKAGGLYVIDDAGVETGPIGAATPYDMFSTLTAAEISVTTTANLTVGRMHVCSGTSADYTVTLRAVSSNTGKMLGVRGSTALTKIITVDGNGAEKVDKQATILLTAGLSYIFLCDGVGWFIVASRSPSRAWINFNGTGTPAINGSFNVSSITDNGTGDFTINFTVAMPSANYVWSGNSFDTTFAGFIGTGATKTMTASALRVGVAKRSDGNYFEDDTIIIQIVGG